MNLPYYIIISIIAAVACLGATDVQAANTDDDTVATMEHTQKRGQDEGKSNDGETLALDISLNTFFHDNEFQEQIVKGYTLPGTRLRPRLTYKPLDNVTLEAGAEALIYDGANKYPNYAYHDIADWRGSQYQEGFHVLPWIRMEGKIGPLTVTIGDLHRKHDLATPMYNTETLLSADSEKGSQLRLATSRYDADVWIDWQSFIFDMDDHQEAFTVGMSHRLYLTPKTSPLTLSVPLQMLVQHRGGEIDLTDKGVQTYTNMAAGLSAEWQTASPVVSAIKAEALMLYATDAGEKQAWPFKNGTAWWMAGQAEMWRCLSVEAGLFTSHRFASLYGCPMFGTLSMTDDGRFDKMTTATLSAQFTHRFSRDYRFIAYARTYHNFCGRLIAKDATQLSASGLSNSFSFGLMLQADMNFKLR